MKTSITMIEVDGHPLRVTITRGEEKWHIYSPVTTSSAIRLQAALGVPGVEITKHGMALTVKP